MRVVWTEPAARRLEDLRAYLREQAGDEVADAILEAIVSRGESLAQHPHRGRRLAERLRADLRELIERGRYRIVYRTRGEVVEIVTVFEHHRLLPIEDIIDDEGTRPRRGGR